MSTRRHSDVQPLRGADPLFLAVCAKDTEILQHVGNKTPTPNSRHNVPVSAETGSLLLVSKQKSCPPRTYALPSSKGQCSSGSITAALAASKRPSPSPAQLRKHSFQPGRDRAAALKSSGQSQRPCGPAETASRSACSNPIRQFLVSEMLVFMRQNS